LKSDGTLYLVIIPLMKTKEPISPVMFREPEPVVLEPEYLLVKTIGFEIPPKFTKVYGVKTSSTFILVEFTKEDDMNKKLYFINFIACILYDHKLAVKILLLVVTLVITMLKLVRLLLLSPSRLYYNSKFPLFSIEFIEPIIVGVSSEIRLEGKLML